MRREGEREGAALSGRGSWLLGPAGAGRAGPVLPGVGLSASELLERCAAPARDSNPTCRPGCFCMSRRPEFEFRGTYRAGTLGALSGSGGRAVCLEVVPKHLTACTRDQRDDQPCLTDQHVIYLVALDLTSSQPWRCPTGRAAC